MRIGPYYVKEADNWATITKCPYYEKEADNWATTTCPCPVYGFSLTPENGFFDPENGQNDPLRGPKFDQKF